LVCFPIYTFRFIRKKSDKKLSLVLPRASLISSLKNKLMRSYTCGQVGVQSQPPPPPPHLPKIIDLLNKRVGKSAALHHVRTRGQVGVYRQDEELVDPGAELSDPFVEDLGACLNVLLAR
jgi:hypothetical protein